jgi:penicillin-binding protein 2
MSQHRRLLLVGAATMLVFAVFAGQLLHMQIIDPAFPPDPDGEEFPKVVRHEAPRGLILDRRGAVLARNVPAFSLVLVPGDLPASEAARDGVLRRIAQLLDRPYDRVARAALDGLNGVDPLAPITLLTGMTREQAIAMRAAIAGLHGAEVRAAPARVYEHGSLFAHVLGHVGAVPSGELDQYLAGGYPMDAAVGLSGLESVYEDALRGEPARRLVLATPYGREVALLGEVAERPGANLVLSIDRELQQATAEALARGIEAGHAKAAARREAFDREPPERIGAAVMLDVRTGEVLAMVSLPSFDANLFSSDGDPAEIARVFMDPEKPLLDRTYMDPHPPGSTFKTIVGLAALEEGVATAGTRITSTGAIFVNGFRLGDWAAHGTLDFYGGMKRSSNVYFFYLGAGYAPAGFQGLGPERLGRYGRAAGLGSPTGIDLPGEDPGVMPDPEWKQEALGEQWWLGDSYTTSIGQGYVRTTPMQMAVMTAAFANGGEVLVPRVVRGYERDGEIELTERQVAGTLPVSDKSLEILRESMRQAAADWSGTAWTGRPDARIDGKRVEIGGKTGTAEFGPLYPDGKFDENGWYIGFAPFDDPEVAVVVYLQHGGGSITAGPVAKAMLDAYFRLRPALHGEAAP